MSVMHLILSPLAPAEMADVDRDIEARLEAYAEARPDQELDLGEPGAGGFIPTRADVEAAYATYRLPLPPVILERLATCRSAYTIDRVRDGGLEGGLEAAVMRLVLERAGPGLVMLVDYPLLTCEDVLARLRALPRIRGFDEPEPTRTRRAVKRRAERPGELRAIQIVARLQAAQADPEAAHDVVTALRRAEPVVARYAALLFEHGAMSDVDAARTLGVDAGALGTAAERLAALLEIDV